MNIDDVKLLISSAPEDEIAAIVQTCQSELWARRKNARKRESWVDRMYRSYLGHPNATRDRKGDMTIVALYECYSGVKIGVAICSPTDTFDEKVGLAVAYAKATGNPVPAYI